MTELHTDKLNNTYQDPISLIKKQPFTLKKHIGEIANMLHDQMCRLRCQTPIRMTHSDLSSHRHTQTHKDPIKRPFWMNIFNEIRGTVWVKPLVHIFSQKVFSLNTGRNHQS